MEKVKYYGFTENDELRVVSVCGVLGIEELAKRKGINNYVELSEDDLNSQPVPTCCCEVKNGKLKPSIERFLRYRINELRGEREMKLKNLDSAFIRALESENSKEIDEIKNTKNELRNFPEKMNKINFESVQELKDYNPL